MTSNGNNETINKISSTEKSTWIFQANPNKYDIFTSLKKEKQEYWNLNQQAKKIKMGDRVLIWISGSEAGIYAIGTVISEVIFRPDSPKGISYWFKKSSGKAKKPRVLVRYEKIFIEEPLLKIFLRYDPNLTNLNIIRSPQGTNFPVTKEEWLAIQDWINKFN